MSAYLLETDAAVHLNNVGIELLVRGCHRQAIETFHDAVKVARSASIPWLLPHGKRSSLSASGTLEDHDRLTHIEEILHKSAKRLANPHPSQRGPGNASTLTVISDDQDPCLIAFEDFSLTNTYLIRIESIAYEAATTDDVAVRAAIILHNYGTSYHSLAIDIALPAYTDLQLGALRMFRLSSNTLLSLESEKDGEQEGMNWSQCGCLTFLLVLRQLIQVTRLLDLNSESEQYMVQLDYLRSLLQGMYNMKDMVAVQHAHAA